MIIFSFKLCVCDVKRLHKNILQFPKERELDVGNALFLVKHILQVSSKNFFHPLLITK